MDKLVDGWREEGMMVEMVVVPGVAHEMAKVHPAIEEFMTRKVQFWWKLRTKEWLHPLEFAEGLS